jgi:hypothetical protein
VDIADSGMCRSVSYSHMRLCVLEGLDGVKRVCGLLEMHKIRAV